MAGLFVLVDLALIEKPLQNSSNNFLVTIADRLRPFVVLHVEFFSEIDKLLRNSFDEFSWRDAGFRGRLLHLLSVLIDTGKEKHALTLEPVIARDHIGQHHFVSVTDMR